ncbi:helix-turn-helix domain-containing protein [Paenibacillus sp. WC2504]|uniref:helix-turn-helix domain-containing protein n=1 Tax=Paenibacillus sp. WC2504 TaxID=3461403 RepID=UPI0040454723
MSNNELYKKVGGNIRKLRINSGISPLELANRISLSRPSVINIENGNHRIQLHTLFQIAEVLKVNVITLLVENTENRNESEISEL